jgi:hypothetical protein
VHLVGFITKQFVTMQRGHMNVKTRHSFCMNSCSFKFVITFIVVLLITESNIQVHSTFRACILVSKMSVVVVFVTDDLQTEFILDVLVFYARCTHNIYARCTHNIYNDSL